MTVTRRYQLAALGLAALLGYLVLARGVVSSEQLIFLLVLIPSVILHEVSHGVVALAFGDDTARRAGRLTLNPLAHVDLFGTILLPAVMLLSGVGAIGYAKPVPVDPSRLRRPRDHGLLVSLTGPAVNVALAVAAALLYRTLYPVGTVVPDLAFQPLLARVLFYLGFANVILAVFNLIPLPPLDGSAVVERLLPASWWPAYLRVRRVSLPVLLFVVLIGAGQLYHLFDPALRLWANLLG